MTLKLSEQQVTTRSSHVLGCASQGSGSGDEARLRTLLSRFEAEFIAFDRNSKRASFRKCLSRMKKGDFDLFVLEGTGLAAGLAAILGHLLYKRQYVLSSGDAVGPFLSANMPVAAPIFHLYERLLYRCCAGFIGWSPYLVGRALTMGAKRGITCAGWAPFQPDAGRILSERREIRERLGIPADAVVFGIAGALVWSDRYQYCYGAELVRAAMRLPSEPYVLIVGGGSGLAHLQSLAGERLGRTILLPGRVSRDQVPGYLSAMDVGSIPQSVDGVGSFRYTTKISEYRAFGLPFLTNEIPMAYDLNAGDIWRLPGDSPWSDPFLSSLASLMRTMAKSPARYLAGNSFGDFDCEAQIIRTTSFLNDLMRSVEGRQEFAPYR